MVLPITSAFDFERCCDRDGRTPPPLRLTTAALDVLALLFILALLPAFSAPAADSFRFTNITEKSIALFEGVRPVFVYEESLKLNR